MHPPTITRAAPMGWRSWNCYHLNISDAKMRSVISAVVSKERSDHAGTPTSLKDLGYARVGIDDGWQECGKGAAGTFHDKAGHPIVNTQRFPDMKGLVDSGHAQGLEMGWYANNCVRNECTLLASLRRA